MKMSRVLKKMIKIPHNGPIYPKGGVTGPIMSPYVEDIQTIFSMITNGIKVVEVLSDGTEINLTARNFDLDLQEKKVDPTPPPIPPVDGTTDAMNEAQTAPPIPPVDETTAEMTETQQTEAPPVDEKAVVNNNGGKTFKHSQPYNKADNLQKK